MQHQSQLDAAYDKSTRTYNYEACFRHVAPMLTSADITIGNLELTLPGPPYSGYPQFGAPDALAAELKRSGVDVLVTANNHSVDKGTRGIERTIQVLDTLGILHTGTFLDSAQRARSYPLIIEQNGFRLALLNYTYGTNGIPVPRPRVVNLIDTAQIRLDLEKAKTLMPDKTIVFFHWGNEYQRSPSKEQRSLAEFSYLHGADMIIGAHPHVLQPIEWNRRQDRLTAWSLGNFVSGQRPRFRDGGMACWLRLERIARDSVSTVRIDSAGYLLSWVHKDEGFTILPVHNFESDTTLLKSATSRLALLTFRDDSRQLLGGSEWSPPELVWNCDLQADRFRIQIAEASGIADPDSVKSELSGLSPLVFVEQREGGYVVQLEDLDDQGIAEVWAEDIRKRTRFVNAEVVRVSDGCPNALQPLRSVVLQEEN